MAALSLTHSHAGLYIRAEGWYGKTMLTRDEVTTRAQAMSDETLLGEYLEARATIGRPGYHDFPNETVEQAAEVAREEILRRMRAAA